MRKCIILFAMLLFLIASCQKSDPIIDFQGNYGTVNFNANFMEIPLSGKFEHVPCSEEVPTRLRYILVNDSEYEFFLESPITIEQKRIINSEEMVLGVGVYTVRDIALLSDSGIVTHRTPSNEATGFDFSVFTDVSTPFDIEIFPAEETIVGSKVLCYTSELLDLGDGKLLPDTTILELQTLYFEMPTAGSFFNRKACIDSVSIVSDGKTIYAAPTIRFGIYGTPIEKYFDEMTLSAFKDGQLLDVVTYFDSSYNVDEEGEHEEDVKHEDVVQFNIQCD